jgi:lipoprotein NlpI
VFRFRLLGAILFIFALRQSALAGGFADFNQGLEARNRADAAAEIEAFTRALADGDLPDSMKPAALYDRGAAYQHEKKYAEAIADFGAVITLKPDYREAYAGRGASNLAIGNYEAALPDCKQLIVFRPDSASLWALCGRIAFFAGRLDEAANHFQHALQLHGKARSASYDLLWLGLTGLKKGKTAASEISDAAQSLDREGWPSPLIAFFLGQIGEDGLLAAAAEGDATTQKDQQCEVGFYLGEWKLAYQDRTKAKALFQQAAQLCSENFIELDPAKVELAKLQGDAR